MAGIQKVRTYEEAFLKMMAEPINVMVSKIVGGKLSPVTNLPEKEGYPPGVAYTQDDVRSLPRVLKEMWSGGSLADGNYFVQATDSNGSTMEWSMVFNAAANPEPGTNGPNSPQQMHPQNQPIRANVGPQSFTAAAPQLHQAPSFAPTPPASDAREMYTRQLEAQVNEMRLQQQRIEDERRREALQRSMNEQVSTIRASFDSKLEQLANIVREVASSRGSSDADPALVELRKQNEELRRQRELDEQRREAERREAALRAEMTELKQMLIAQNSQPKTDPMLPVLVEIMKSTMETLKEKERSGPQLRDLVDLVERGRGGMDSMMLKQSEMFMGVWNILKTGMETVHGLRPQETPTNPLLNGLATAVAGLPDAIKEFAAASRGPSQAEMMNAGSMMIPMQHIGEIATPPVQQIEAPQQMAAAEPTPQPVVAAPPAPPPVPINRDVQLFESVLPHVKLLREAVRRGVEGLPATEAEPALADPKGAVSAILEALDQIGRAGLKIKAVDLFMTGQISAFVEAMLPDAPSAYRTEVIKYLNDVHQQALRVEAEQAKPAASK